MEAWKRSVLRLFASGHNWGVQSDTQPAPGRYCFVACRGLLDGFPAGTGVRDEDRYITAETGQRRSLLAMHTVIHRSFLTSKMDVAAPIFQRLQFIISCHAQCGCSVAQWGRHRIIRVKRAIALCGCDLCSLSDKVWGFHFVS